MKWLKKFEIYNVAYKLPAKLGFLNSPSTRHIFAFVVSLFPDRHDIYVEGDFETEVG
jgi:hypothetical protein